MTEPSNTTQPPVDLDAHAVKRMLEQGGCVLIDVREPFEHSAERIEGAVSVPLASLDPDKLRGQYPDQQIVFHCAGGKRSASACKRFAEGQDGPAQHLAGGIAAWKQAQLPTLKPDHAPALPIMQQVQITAGSLVVVGLALGYFVTPGFYLLSAFVGCGLVFAGTTGWCGMAKLLGAMPWNRA